MLHRHILSDEQKHLLPLINLFRNKFYLVGGTAIALHLGHRRSIDFDLFTIKRVNRIQIKKILSDKSPGNIEFGYEDVNQMHAKINSVKITFFNYPYSVPATIDFDGIINLPSLPDLAAMKAFAFGQRAKWKDYVDMYFLLKNNLNFNDICKRTENLFNINKSIVFTEKLFRQQLSYFKNIDYSEPVEFIGNPVPDDEIRNFLTEVALTPF